MADCCVVCGGERYGRMSVDGKDYAICVHHSTFQDQVTVVAAARLATLTERDKRIAELETKLGNALNAWTDALADAGDLDDRIAQLEEALRFYASKRSWVPEATTQIMSNAAADKGKRARQALDDKGEVDG